MKIYTRTGDNGTTSLIGGTRVPKNSPRIEAYGTIDELNSHLGLLAADKSTDPETTKTIQQIQNTLFNLGAQLATEPQSTYQPPKITPQDITKLENLIDTTQKQIPPLTQFVLPGGTQAAAQAHICRTIARRAERKILNITPVDPLAIQYINRLSDYLFTLARLINKKANHPEPTWTPQK